MRIFLLLLIGGSLIVLGLLGLRLSDIPTIQKNAREAIIAEYRTKSGDTDQSFRVIDGTEQKVPFRVPVGGVVTLLIKGTVMLQNSRRHCLNVAPDYAVTHAYSEDGLTYFVTPKTEKQEKIEVTSLREGEEDCGSSEN